jgi:hypothetical protein
MTHSLFLGLAKPDSRADTAFDAHLNTLLIQD